MVGKTLLPCNFIMLYFIIVAMDARHKLLTSLWFDMKEINLKAERVVQIQSSTRRSIKSI